MKINLVGGTTEEFSTPFNPNRSVNLYPVVSRDGKEITALYSTPGLKEFTRVGSGAIRGVFKSGNGRFFVISGAKLYEVLVDGSTTELGTLQQNTGNVSIAEVQTQLGICDGVNVYILKYSDDSFQRVTDADLPEASTITSIDSFFVITKLNSGKFFISEVLDGTKWDALDFASAEKTPDNVLRAFAGAGQLWLFGEKTTEIWNNTGDATFPFQRISGATFNTGIVAPLSAVEIDKNIYWVGQDDGGRGQVYVTSGFSAQPISTPPITQMLERADNIEDIVSYFYSQDGHTFYVINGGGLETSLVFDTTTKTWHERAFTNDSGQFEPHLVSTHAFVFGLHIGGSRKDNRLFRIGPAFFDDDGDEMVRERIYGNISQENKNLRINRLEVDFEGGVGLQSGQGFNPQARLQVSKDGGKTYGIAASADIGKAGQYEARAVFRRLGVANNFVFKLRVSDPVKVVMTGSFIE